MKNNWLIVTILGLFLSMSCPAIAEEPLKDGWKQVVPIPAPLTEDNERYVTWVEHGWLQVRRETAAGQIVWHVVLAHASHPEPPVVSSPGKDSFRFEVSYRNGRYFVREDVSFLSCLRERKPDEPAAWPAVPFEKDRYQQRAAAGILSYLFDETWSFVISSPRRGMADVMVRLAPTDVGREVGAMVIRFTPFSRMERGDAWIQDDGELLTTLWITRSTQEALKVGDMAPAFTAKSMDGKSISLEDFRGKYVLLDFWATWCGPCIAEFPHLEEAHKEFVNDNRFAMVGLSVDEDIDVPKRYLARRQLPWQQAFIGMTSGVSRDYRAERIPLIVLIGPDGKILAVNLRGENLKKVIAEIMANK